MAAQIRGRDAANKRALISPRYYLRRMAGFASDGFSSGRT
jgi:hypothetical protein